ncbi:MAG: metallophosphoesterase [Lachnospiraceae bacterium]|nr:metallophosphoesterase [Lachnospiraceae bacterium]
MKILIVSDTHGRLGNVEMVLEKVKPIDMMIHCGDIERDEEYLRMIAGCPVYMVSGNNDWGLALDRELMIQIGKYRVMVTHGHHYSVYYDLNALAQVAKDKGADVVMFGHTHVPAIERIDGITLVNPGSLTLPRQYGRVPTYAFMEIDEDGEAHFTISELSL